MSQQPDLVDWSPLELAAQRRLALAARWSSPKLLRSHGQAVARLAQDRGATCVAAATPEATGWALVLADALRLKLTQPGMALQADETVVLVEPVLATGAGMSRAAASAREAGARRVIGVVGEGLQIPASAADVGVDELIFL